MHLTIKLVLLLAISCSLAVSQSAKRVSVVLEHTSQKADYSLFFKHVESRGYKLDYFTEDDTIKFRTYGEWNYDNLILFTPAAAELPSGLSVKAITEFIDDGKNVLVVGSSEIGKPIADIASECSVEFDEEQTFVIDHLNYNASDVEGQHTLLAVEPTNVVDAKIIFPKKIEAPILYKGVGQDIEEDSSLLFCVLHGDETSYSFSPEEKIEELHVAGKKTCLVSALQARNNARVVFVGSIQLFSNAYFTSPVQKNGGKSHAKSGNADFSTQLAEWLFQERGILRAANVKHHKKGEKDAPFTYTIKDQVEYSVDIQEWNGKDWVPFLAEDVQLEFRMLDPYIRTTLKHDKNGKYQASFMLPDVYGVFTFKIEYIRHGYGTLTSVTRTPVRPFRHNEYERFIASAYPYYASAFSMMAGLFVFSWFFLYHRDSKV